jgi:hypothetical protein
VRVGVHWVLGLCRGLACALEFRGLGEDRRHCSRGCVKLPFQIVEMSWAHDRAVSACAIQTSLGYSSTLFAQAEAAPLGACGVPP